jgi:hypothetical protein
MLIIRRLNCFNTACGIVTVCRCPFGAQCCIVVPAGTALLFCCNPFIDVYRHMLIAALVFMLHGQGQSSKISVFTRLPRKQSGWWSMVKHLRTAIAEPVSWQWIPCTPLEILRCITQWIQPLFLTLELAVSGARCPEFIWRVRLQRWSLISVLFLVCNN